MIVYKNVKKTNITKLNIFYVLFNLVIFIKDKIKSKEKIIIGSNKIEVEPNNIALTLKLKASSSFK